MPPPEYEPVPKNDPDDVKIVIGEAYPPRSGLRKKSKFASYFVLGFLVTFLGLLLLAKLRVFGDDKSADLLSEDSLTVEEPVFTETTELPRTTQSAKISNGTEIESVKLHYRGRESLNLQSPLTAPLCPVRVDFVDDELIADIVVLDSDRGMAAGFNRSIMRLERPFQTGAIFGVEAAPQRVGMQEYYDALGEGRDRDTFDYSMTYRLDSDVPAVYSYGFFNYDNPPVEYDKKRQDSIVAAFVTNCHPLNHRSLILEELEKLLGNQIHSFGACKNNANAEYTLKELGLWEGMGDPEWWNMKITTIRHYKFTIAMENSNAVDYVTEKYFQAMEQGTVPIHLGNPTFKTSFLPSPNAAIDIADYMPSNYLELSRFTEEEQRPLTKEEKKGLYNLAERLKYLASPEGRTEYEEMIAWKKGPWRESPFGQVAKLGRHKYSEACRLAGIHLGKDWALSGWFPTPERIEQDKLRKAQGIYR